MVDARVQVDMAGTILSGRVKDLCPGGAFVAFSGERPRVRREDKVMVTVYLEHVPYAPVLQLEGRVRWAGHSELHRVEGVGLGFTRPVLALESWLDDEAPPEP